MDSNHTCLVAISLDIAIYKNENYYLQLFIKECKNIEKQKKLDILARIFRIFLIMMSLMINKLE